MSHSDFHARITRLKSGDRIAVLPGVFPTAPPPPRRPTLPLRQVAALAPLFLPLGALGMVLTWQHMGSYALANGAQSPLLMTLVVLFHVGALSAVTHVLSSPKPLLRGEWAVLHMLAGYALAGTVLLATGG